MNGARYGRSKCVNSFLDRQTLHVSYHLWVLAWDLQISVLHFEFQVHGGCCSGKEDRTKFIKE